MVLTLLVFLLGLSTVLPACDRGWASFQGECFLFSRTPKNWQDAEGDCRKHGAYLTTDDNKAKHDFLTSFLNVFTSWGYTHFWLGGTDYTVENRWQWLETGALVNSGFSAWAPGEPNGNLSQNCIATMFNQTTEMFWIDSRCTVHKTGYHYICEKQDQNINPGNIIG